jgi:hypothetical protein
MVNNKRLILIFSNFKILSIQKAYDIFTAIVLAGVLKEWLNIKFW